MCYYLSQSIIYEININFILDIIIGIFLIATFMYLQR